MELHLSMPELTAIIDAARERDHANHKFAAALKGIDLDDEAQGSDEERFEEIEARAKAKLAGISQDEYQFSQLGLGIEAEGDEMD